MVSGGPYSDANKTCSRCGSEYAISYYKLRLRDTDSIDCEVCGARLMEWSHARMYSAQLTKRTEWPPPSN